MLLTSFTCAYSSTFFLSLFAILQDPNTSKYKIKLTINKPNNYLIDKLSNKYQIRGKEV